MARTRERSRSGNKQAGNKQQAGNAAVNSNTASPVTPNTPVANNGTVIKERGLKMALTPDQIQQLLGQTRQKGQYTDMLTEFLASGEGGVNAMEQWVAIKEKKASTVKQGFVNAIEKKDGPEGRDKVKVLVNEEQVYLINLAAANVEAPAA